jgi:hypothetical protein
MRFVSVPSFITLTTEFTELPNVTKQLPMLRLCIITHTRHRQFTLYIWTSIHSYQCHFCTVPTYSNLPSILLSFSLYREQTSCLQCLSFLELKFLSTCFSTKLLLLLNYPISLMLPIHSYNSLSYRKGMLYQIRWTPPVSRKKFHLPRRAGQDNRGTKGDRV